MTSESGSPFGPAMSSAPTKTLTSVPSASSSVSQCGLPSQFGSAHQKGFQPDSAILCRRSATARCSSCESWLKSGSDTSLVPVVKNLSGLGRGVHGDGHGAHRHLSGQHAEHVGLAVLDLLGCDACGLAQHAVVGSHVGLSLL